MVIFFGRIVGVYLIRIGVDTGFKGVGGYYIVFLLGNVMWFGYRSFSFGRVLVLRLVLEFCFILIVRGFYVKGSGIDVSIWFFGVGLDLVVV